MNLTKLTEYLPYRKLFFSKCCTLNPSRHLAHTWNNCFVCIFEKVSVVTHTHSGSGFSNKMQLGNFPKKFPTGALEFIIRKPPPHHPTAGGCAQMEKTLLLFRDIPFSFAFPLPLWGCPGHCPATSLTWKFLVAYKMSPFCRSCSLILLKMFMGSRTAQNFLPSQQQDARFHKSKLRGQVLASPGFISSIRVFQV